MGCWMGSPGGGQRVCDMVQKAIKSGYRHFDTASGYDNEEQVGKAIKDSGIPRSEFYITTKLGNTAHHQVQEAFAESLRKLDSEYIDLYLMHWPQASIDGRVIAPEESPTIIETWKEMEKLLDTGKVKTIGVSNFSIKTLQILLPHCSVIPATNQVELHPFLPCISFKKFCEEKGILLTAYSPLGRPVRGQPGPLNDPTVVKLAEKLKADPAQVIVSWGVQKNIIMIPKTENETRIRTNITLVTLSDDDLNTIDKIHTEPGKHRSTLTYHDQTGRVFGWTYEQLGWDMRLGGIVTSVDG
ncbi:Aldo/keto reductase [Marasmius fiardii PR-910]|nr:Aldo/keto reductase [Marasmius fiardii PR-910]